MFRIGGSASFFRVIAECLCKVDWDTSRNTENDAQRTRKSLATDGREAGGERNAFPSGRLAEEPIGAVCFRSAALLLVSLRMWRPGLRPHRQAGFALALHPSEGSAHSAHAEGQTSQSLLSISVVLRSHRHGVPRRQKRSARPRPRQAVRPQNARQPVPYGREGLVRVRRRYLLRHSP